MKNSEFHKMKYISNWLDEKNAIFIIRLSKKYISFSPTYDSVVDFEQSCSF